MAEPRILNSDVVTAVENLAHLTTCRCAEDYTARGRHDPRSDACDHADDVDLIARVLGVRVNRRPGT